MHFEDDEEQEEMQSALIFAKRLLAFLPLWFPASDLPESTRILHQDSHEYREGQDRRPARLRVRQRDARLADVPAPGCFSRCRPLEAARDKPTNNPVPAFRVELCGC